MTATRELEPRTPRCRPQLTWTDGAGSHALELAETRTAGSAVHCELVVADKSVSRLHFELDPQPDGLWVRDLGSRNGTYVNGVKIVEARVPAGSVIRVGTTDMTVAYGNPEPPAEPSRADEPTAFGGLEGWSASMREVFATLASLAKTESSIIIEGEPGTGKKALARAVHDASARAGAPFVVVECAGLPNPSEIAEALEEALGSAEGGTLVLDAPAELPLAVQRELTPPFDAKAFRVIVTTQRDLRRLVNQGAFRENLYFRIAGATVRVPPLRERRGDLVPLLERFLGEQVELATPSLLADLERLPWMGNVRELRLYAEGLRSGDLVRAVATAHLDAVDSDDFRNVRLAEGDLGTMEAPTLPTLLGSEPAAADIGRMLPIALEPWFLIGFKEFRERWIDLGEREYLRRLMLRTSRSSSAASREAGLERTYLYRLLKKHGV
ncbi:MAG: sigma 54-dependent Fis family transcriptional regulator [Labilithrix sp.]|nr:sigma 54-dependent Fis family transcriptional regulator [Labilithrix sp.]MCW5835120.1 sigma 54-dependent Fis family transcriptional regulator [Labilithrix sp.]